MTDLPPNQRAIDHFPRFGAYYAARATIEAAPPVVEIRGAVRNPVAVPVGRLRILDRLDQVSAFHCVTGWSRKDLRWSGVRFRTFYDSLIAPEAKPAPGVTHVVFEGADGFRATCCIADALEDDVILADMLEGEPLTFEHGAPVRVVSPRQYGYKSVKHLVAIELHDKEPRDWHFHPLRRLLLALLKPHPRARVDHEERHRTLPAYAVRWIYRRLIRPFIWLGSRG